jgi:hypothetical protein
MLYDVNLKWVASWATRFRDVMAAPSAKDIGNGGSNTLFKLHLAMFPILQFKPVRQDTCASSGNTRAGSSQPWPYIGDTY